MYKFKKIILHNFLSYGHSEIDLSDRSFCAVKGINKCPKDNAISNGAGKSSWISGLCWCLTGETAQGLNKNIKNIFIDEDSCYVTLYFDVNGDSYEITRIKEPSPNMKIIINGVDKSGKGIRESELALATLLPDLTGELISSIIVLGQGMPNKFTNNSPSGRKEVLEKLSKSDFMIEDIKNRITTRYDNLNKNIQTKKDNLLQLDTQLQVYQKQIQELITNRDTYNAIDYNKEISSLETKIKDLSQLLDDTNKKLNVEETKLSELSNNLLKKSDSKQQELNEELSSYNNIREPLITNKSIVEAKIEALRLEITKLKDIKDICPTCGQKIPGVIKKDTSEQEKSLENLQQELKVVNDKISSCLTTHNDYIKTINSDYNDTINIINNDITTCKKLINEYRTTTLNTSSDKNNLEQDLVKIKLKKDNEDKWLKELNDKITNYTTLISNLTSESSKVNNDINKLNEHLTVVKKMDTLVKRDFRGFLLLDIINFIDAKAKEYCNDVFGTTELDFKLKGNNIDITYCGKDFESLSGGEQQKINIIIQFSLRDMMSQYLDFNSNILVLDEIFDNLDINGSTNILNLISNKLNDVESVFIISHHDDLELPCDSELIIYKNEKGISSVQ